MFWVEGLFLFDQQLDVCDGAAEVHVQRDHVVCQSNDDDLDRSAQHWSAAAAARRRAGARGHAAAAAAAAVAAAAAAARRRARASVQQAEGQLGWGICHHTRTSETIANPRPTVEQRHAEVSAEAQIQKVPEPVDKSQPPTLPWQLDCHDGGEVHAVVRRGTRALKDDLLEG